MAIAIPLGILAAVKQNKITDYIIRIASLIGNSLPNFVVAILLMYFLSIKLGWFPILSKGTSLYSAILPTLTLAYPWAANT